MVSDMDLSIIIVNWNTQELLSQCLRSVDKTVRVSNCLEVETIVIDNASTDGSVQMVREQFAWAQLIENTENLGFARANNQALKLARGNKLLLLNPDTVATEGAIELLSGVLDGDAGTAIVGAQLLNADGSLQPSSGAFPSLWSELPLINRRLNHKHQIASVSVLGQDYVVRSVDWVSGACLMIKRETCDAIGLLDESFWLYTEEADWCYRARQTDRDVLLVPDAQIYHITRASSGQRFVFTMLHFYQSRVRFANKHYGWPHASALKQILRVKAAIWQKRPNGSPLRGAYPKLSDEQITSAYRTLGNALAMPLAEYLANDWK
jgi:GT2 family glycosyltransferase